LVFFDPFLYLPLLPVLLSRLFQHSLSTAAAVTAAEVVLMVAAVVSMVAAVASTEAVITMAAVLVAAVRTVGSERRAP
jgi:lysylphosphatidylglycerol synthetase-like protein (DUF2156 family)